MSPLYLILLLVAMQRLGELALARRNTQLLLQRGAVEVGAGHYPLLILLHSSWLLAILLTTPSHAPVNGWLLALLILLQWGRVWTIAVLGRYWTTRIINVPGTPLIRKGPYRFIRHPNYWIVVGEIAVLPLIFGNWPVAFIWSIANAAMLAWRIKIENAALVSRQPFCG